ncbi:hypothetical protein RRSWK_03182 [Rhodopirellula sp. SWK7]|nr:hypothetical protein RRSWK_03182 [Rhodopirellula sp. SWK7]
MPKRIQTSPSHETRVRSDLAIIRLQFCCCRFVVSKLPVSRPLEETRQ